MADQLSVTPAVQPIVVSPTTPDGGQRRERREPRPRPRSREGALRELLAEQGVDADGAMPVVQLVSHGTGPTRVRIVDGETGAFLADVTAEEFAAAAAAHGLAEGLLVERTS